MVQFTQQMIPPVAFVHDEDSMITTDTYEIEDGGMYAL